MCVHVHVNSLLIELPDHFTHSATFKASNGLNILLKTTVMSRMREDCNYQLIPPKYVLMKVCSLNIMVSSVWSEYGRQLVCWKLCVVQWVILWCTLSPVGNTGKTSSSCCCSRRRLPSGGDSWECSSLTTKSFPGTGLNFQEKRCRCDSGNHLRHSNYPCFNFNKWLPLCDSLPLLCWIIEETFVWLCVKNPKGLQCL